MAIYLGGQKVSPLSNIIIEKTITVTKDTNGNIISTSDPVYSGVSNESNFTIEDPDNLSIDLPVVTEWTRPNDWPNLDALPTLTEGVYLTYDNTKVDYKWACFYCDVQSSGQVTIAQGHINGSSFVQDATWNVNTATYKEIDYSSSSYDYVIFKITPTTSTKHMTSMYFGRIAQATLGTLALRQQQNQHCLERKGWLPYLSSTAGSGDNIRYCTEWMEHDNVEFGNTVTSLVAAWYRGRSLKKIEFGNWTGANCNITALNSAFEQCNTIEKIDLSQWDTTNWKVGSIASMFSSCFNMKICIVPFNTINWGSGAGRTLAMNSTWYNCHTVEELNLNSWNMTGINVTAINSCWQNCYHLKSLNVKNWNTSLWSIPSLYYTWGNCRLLVDIDLSNWNTTNWKPTRWDGCFYSNENRRHFEDIKNWNTSGWKIKESNDVFAHCRRVQEINLLNYDTSQWAVTSMSNIFGSCYAARYIRIGSWNTTNWKVTNINYLFANDYNLEEVECFSSTQYPTAWNTTNWVVRYGMYQTFMGCLKIKEIDFTKWNMTNWPWATNSGDQDIRYLFQYCYNLKKINMSNLDLTTITSLNYYSQNAAGSRSYSPFYYCFSLEELTLPNNGSYKGHIDMSEMYKLPRSEFIKTFNALSSSPIGTTAKVWIVNTKYKLTTADIAIATNKGYTVIQS